MVLHEVVHQVDSVTHPLIRDAGGKFAIKPKFKVKAWIERSVRLGHEPGIPVGISFTNLHHFCAPAPSGSVIIPLNFDLADVAENATLYRFVSEFGIRFTAMLRSHLHDQPVLQHRVASRFNFDNTLPMGFSTDILAASSGHFKKGE
jgi:hypothetical protein